MSGWVGGWVSHTQRHKGMAGRQVGRRAGRKGKARHSRQADRQAESVHERRKNREILNVRIDPTRSMSVMKISIVYRTVQKITSVWIFYRSYHVRPVL